MASFVSTATTMFNRFPLRHSRQPKEPSIGSPVLVDSTRSDVLLLSGDSEKGLKSLPPLPTELDHTFSPGMPTRYTTTPNFEQSPIMPSHSNPPAFYHIQQPAPFAEPPSPPSQGRKNVFSRKPVPATLQTRKDSGSGSKSIDLMQASHQPQSKPRLGSLTEDNEKGGLGMGNFTDIASSPKPSNEPLTSPVVKAKAPRLRDSIVPAMKPLDRTFLGDMRTQQEFDQEFGMPENDRAQTSTPRLLSQRVMDELSGAEQLMNPRVRRAGPKELSARSISDSGAPMLDMRAPLTPIFDQTLDSPSIMLSSYDDANNEATPPQTPPQISADEHIAQLELERDRLVVAQRELTRDMEDIQAVLPPNPSTHDFKQRKKLKETLARLQSEYDGMGKELHETGMLLHRAWRRRDVKLGLEAPAVLWVRRVSN